MKNLIATFLIAFAMFCFGLMFGYLIASLQVCGKVGDAFAQGAAYQKREELAYRKRIEKKYKK